MPRGPRIVAVGYPHHITQRGNYMQDTFTHRLDYFRYLQLMDECSGIYNMSILAYCLMPNHVHFIVIPNENESLSKTLSLCHMRYSHYFNMKVARTGHLWQNRFHSCVLDEPHLYAAVRYVENNPVRAKLIEKAEDWEWSSARSHIYKSQNIIKLDDVHKLLEVADWREYLRLDDESMITKIRSSTLSGCPLGSENFISVLERSFGRRLRLLRRGRKKKDAVQLEMGCPNPNLG